jgi:hypothetical protein
MLSETFVSIVWKQLWGSPRFALRAKKNSTMDLAVAHVAPAGVEDQLHVTCRCGPLLHTVIVITATGRMILSRGQHLELQMKSFGAYFVKIFDEFLEHTMSESVYTMYTSMGS